MAATKLKASLGVNATGTPSSTTFLAGDNSWTAVSSDYVLLATTDASSSASVSFDGYFSSTYKNYKIIGSNVIPATDNTQLKIRYRKSNSDVTTSNYKCAGSLAYWYNNSGASGYGGGYNQTSFYISNDTNDNTASFGGSNFEILLFDPLNTTSYKWFIAKNCMIDYDQNFWYIYNFSGFLTDNTTALSGISFFQSSGNISSGNFKLYGIK